MILIDTIPFQYTPPKILTESEHGGRSILTVEGIVQRADYENGNGRIYPRTILEREIERYQEKINERNAVGELDHRNESVVELKNASHKITKVWWDGNDVWATLEILTTPAGNIVRELFNCGVNVGISSRGTGSTYERNGRTVVADDFSLLCWDLVSVPSTQGAFVKPIMTEGKNAISPDRYQNINSLIYQILSI